MIRFRPIAPKPAVDGSEEVPITRPTRQKRRYVKSKNKKKVVSEEVNIAGSDQHSEVGEEAVTLSLLPDTPVSFYTTSSHLDRTWIQESTRMIQPQQQQQSPTSLEFVAIMECVEGITSSDMIDLENDTCPGFISNGYGRVRWTNPAYRKMVGSKEARVVMIDRFPVTWGSAFLCRVKLEYTLRGQKKSLIVPCDVWEICGGDFAWRLDVQAALTLGR